MHLDGAARGIIVGVEDLTAAQRAHVRRNIAAELVRTRARILALERTFDDIVTASAEAVRDDEHDPEGATIAYERAQVAALLNDSRVQLAALEQAERRITAPNAWQCDRCAGPIGYDRLLARPAATTCVTCARRRLS